MLGFRCMCYELYAADTNIKIEFDIGYFQWYVSRASKFALLDYFFLKIGSKLSWRKTTQANFFSVEAKARNEFYFDFGITKARFHFYSLASTVGFFFSRDTLKRR